MDHSKQLNIALFHLDNLTCLISSTLIHDYHEIPEHFTVQYWSFNTYHKMNGFQLATNNRILMVLKNRPYLHNTFFFLTFSISIRSMEHNTLHNNIKISRGNNNRKKKNIRETLSNK